MPFSGGGGASKISSLTDVTLAALASGQSLFYDASLTRWENVALGNLTSPVANSITTFDPTNKNANVVLSNGNLTMTNATNANDGALTTFAKTSGKLYYELTINAIGAITAITTGVGKSNANLASNCGSDLNSIGYQTFNGTFYFGGSGSAAPIGTITAGSVIGVAVDFTNKNVWIRLSPTGNWNGVGTDNPATNTGGLFGGGTFFLASQGATFFASPLFIMSTTDQNSQATLNVGGSAFSGALPSGFSAWNTGETAGSAAAIAIPYPQLPASVQHFPLEFSLSGKPGVGALQHAPCAVPLTIPANLAGTRVFQNTIATANAVWTVNKITLAGVLSAIGTITFNTTSKTAVTLSTQAAVSLAAGDVLQLVAPNPQDATLADWAITIDALLA